jgi:LysM repeat protein
VKALSKSVSGRAIVVAGTVSMAVLAGCSSNKVLTDRPFIPAPSDQMSSGGLVALPPIDSNIAPISDVPPFVEPKIEALSYTVKKGDSLWKIARIHGVSMQELAAFNNMDLKKILKVGDIVRIPPGGALIPQDKLPPIKKVAVAGGKGGAKSAGTEEIPADGVYTVKNGDSLWKIAKKFNTSVDKVAAANGMDAKTPLQVGQKLRISGSGPAVGETVSKPIVSDTPVEDKAAPPMELDIEVDTIDTGIGGLDDVVTEEDRKSIQDNPSAMTPSPAPSTAPLMDDIKGSMHDVSEGETWSEIAKFYGIKTEELKRANPSASAVGEPKPGTQVVIPVVF